MQLKQEILRYIKNKIFTLLIIIISANSFANVKVRDSINRIKIDGILAVIGNYVILDSDIDKTLLELKSKDNSASFSRCEILENLMEEKLYAHHAIQDSLEYSEGEIYSQVDNNIDYFKQQLGSIEKVLEFYGQEDYSVFRNQLFEILKTKQLSQLKQLDIVENIEVTPEEVKNFFEGIPTSDLPIFGDEVEISQIVIKPQPNEEEIKRVFNQLNKFREDVLEQGQSFASKAILYSQDPGSRASGGKYTLNRKQPRMVKEFREVAFSLEEGEVSEPFETEFGWHIIQVDKILGQNIDVRHILLIPEVNNDELIKSRSKLDSIRNNILEEKIDFENAAILYSDEKVSKNNGGVLINPVTGDKRFELTNMDPTLYKQIFNLKNDEISLPILEIEPSGQKKYKIIKINKRYNSHVASYEKDYLKIKDLALKEKQLNSIYDWINNNIESTYISLSREAKKCDLKNEWKRK